MDLKFDINNKKFVTTGNEEGLSSEKTVFHYYTENEIIKGKYEGGEILEGQIVGKYISEERIELLFQCITKKGELKSGCSVGELTFNEKGKLLIAFKWNWLNGDKSGGNSYYMEV